MSAKQKWMPIETAPLDGTVIIARIPGYGDKNRICAITVVDDNDLETWAWFYVEGKSPPCWTDAVCWASNEDEEPSVQPTHWMPEPPK